MTISRNNAIGLGKLMCSVTEELLWQPAACWIRKRGPGGSLQCRVGSGQATYHRYDPHTRQHQITYGVRMIMAKQQAENAIGWLSSREIQQRGYFGGELTTLNLLAHTCCHEFAHLLQHSAGKRFYGSVHNHHFYEILDQLHGSGGAGAARDYLAELSRQQGLPMPHEPFEIIQPQQLTVDWQVGDAVRFGHGQTQHHGKIIRVNRKTCTVAGTGPSRGLRYRVPVSLLGTPDS